MNRHELLSLPVSVDFRTGYEAIGIGSTVAYKLAAEGKFPVRLLRLGSRYRVVTADLLALLGVDPTPVARSDADARRASRGAHNDAT